MTECLLPCPGPSLSTVLWASSLQTPTVAAVYQTPPTTSSLSGLRPVSVPRLSVPFQPGSGFLNQKGICTFKILPATSTGDHVVTCSRAPSKLPVKLVTSPGSFTVLQPNQQTPVNLIPLTPSAGRGAELRTDIEEVSAAPVLQEPHNTPTEMTTAASAPPGSEVRPGCRPSSDRTSPGQEMARNLVDLDIICVDDEAEVFTSRTEGRAERVLDVVDLMDSSSGETENSSDFGDESDTEGPKGSTLNDKVRKNKAFLLKKFVRKLISFKHGSYHS